MCSLRTPGDCMLTIPTLLFQTTSPSWSGWLRANHCCPNDACCCSLRCNVSLPYAGADIQLAIVGDRLISVDVRRIVLDWAQALSDCGRPRSRPGPHPWPAPPAQRAARLAAAVAPDKLISRDAGGGRCSANGGRLSGPMVAGSSLLHTSSSLLACFSHSLPSEAGLQALTHSH